VAYRMESFVAVFSLAYNELTGHVAARFAIRRAAGIRFRADLAASTRNSCSWRFVIMPDAARVLATIRQATRIFRESPGRHGSQVLLDDAEEVIVVGDLHGNIPALRQVFEYADLDNHKKRHLVLQELIHGPRMYPNDGGDRSHQLVDLVCGLKCRYARRVHVILGNHELSEITGRAIAKNGVPLNALYHIGVRTAYGELAEEICEAYRELFLAYPLAVRTPNRVLICHTMPDGHWLDQFDPEILQATSWTAPQMARGGSVYMLTWGRDIAPETADRFLGMMDADWLITGHQPCDEGYSVANHRQIIIDGTDPFPTFLHFDARDPITLEKLKAGIHVLRHGDSVPAENE